MPLFVSEEFSFATNTFLKLCFPHSHTLHTAFCAHDKSVFHNACSVYAQLFSHVYQKKACLFPLYVT
jgi:hypothetical protein